MKKLATILFAFLILFSNNIKAQTKKPKADNNFKNIVLFWDTSLSVKDKDLELELTFLEAFINDKSNLSIHLVKFSNAIISEKTYKIENANWHILKQALLHTTYDGATSFLPLVATNYANYDAFLVFTDGYQNETILRTDITKPLIVVSSSEKTYFNSLQLKTLSNDSHFIDFNKQTLSNALKELGIKNTSQIVYKPKKVKKTRIVFSEVTGNVSTADGPLEGVNIKLEGKKIGAVTDSKGYYIIAAKKNDKLIFSYLGFRSFRTVVLDSTLDIRLLSDETRLKAVEINGKKSEIIDGDEDVMGSKKNRKLGYSVTTVKSEDFNINTTTVSDNIRGKVSAAELGVDQDISKMVLRGRYTITGNVYPLVVIDGVQLERANYGEDISYLGNGITAFIDPENVAKIKILRGLAATNRYGSEGRNGVIEITSKTATANKGRKKVNNAMVKNNFYKEDLKNTVSNTAYISILKKSKTLEEAYDTYLKLRGTYGNTLAFYLESSDYFKHWQAKVLSDRILSNLLELNFNNPVGLKALAFKYEADKDLIKAGFVYKRILRLQPKSAQSYKDLATLYAEKKYVTKAFYLYKSMLENTVKNVDFSGLTISNTSEFKALIQLNKNTIPKVAVADNYLKIDNVNVRLYFEWIDPDMSFDIQFVNPQKRFFSWTHSQDNDANRIENEKLQGFTAEEFLLIDAAKGTWLINLTNLNSKYPKDQILKLNVYKNYGKPNQTKEVKVINLKNYNKKATLVKIEI